MRKLTLVATVAGALLTTAFAAHAVTKTGSFGVTLEVADYSVCTVVGVDPTFPTTSSGETNVVVNATPAQVQIDCGTLDIPDHTVCIGGSSPGRRWLSLDGAAASADHNFAINPAGTTDNVGTSGTGCTGHGIADAYNFFDGLSFTGAPSVTTAVHDFDVTLNHNVGQFTTGVYSATVPFAVVF
jgi:hypothetical protein